MAGISDFLKKLAFVRYLFTTATGGNVDDDIGMQRMDRESCRKNKGSPQNVWGRR
jgi:hypothetical protein